MHCSLYADVTLYIFLPLDILKQNNYLGTLIRKLLWFFKIFFCWGLLDLKHHLSTAFNAIDISSFAWHATQVSYKMSWDHSPWLPCRCLTGQFPVHTTRVRSWTPLSCHVSVSCQEKNVRTMRVCIVVPLLARCTTRTSDCQWTVWDGSQSVCATASCASAALFSDFSPSNQLVRKMEKETEREDLFPSCKIPWVLKFDEGFFVR